MATSPTPTEKENPRISLLSVALLFLHMGAFTFGGMWGAMERIEQTLVTRKKLITSEELRAMMITAALIPGPKFLNLGGMVGYRARGYPGSIVALICLALPGAVLVTIAAILLPAGEEGSLLAALQKMVGYGLVGLLLGNAIRIIARTKLPRATTIIGLTITVSIPVAVLVFDVSLIVMAILGLTIGTILIRPMPADNDAEKKEALDE